VATYVAKNFGDGFLLYYLVRGSALVNGRLLDQLVFKLQFESRIFMGKNQHLNVLSRLPDHR
jgi:hypothetical protein